eukprot:9082452-Lingulodinium_polyedra.AAC.1
MPWRGQLPIRRQIAVIVLEFCWARRAAFRGDEFTTWSSFRSKIAEAFAQQLAGKTPELPNLAVIVNEAESLVHGTDDREIVNFPEDGKYEALETFIADNDPAKNI